MNETKIANLFSKYLASNGIRQLKNGGNTTRPDFIIEFDKNISCVEAKDTPEFEQLLKEKGLDKSWVEEKLGTK